jgi:hypothetical protein
MKGNWLFIMFLLMLLACNESGSENSIDSNDDKNEEANNHEVIEIGLADTSIQTFIEAAYPGEFVKLTEPDQLPGSVIPHLDSIKAYFERENLNDSSYFVWIAHIDEDSTSLSIPVWDLDAFYFDREHFGEYVGSPSQGSGTLEIELSSGMVLQRWKWQ